ncbi:hypothetical protein [Candidatus Palauibacter sp.]|uniref:hypothetical protein n=1 Tax=Candidatus Palauibacter sp. TaxID=3101350 RepID=UPI003CC566D8
MSASPDDEALVEHDASELEGLNLAIEQGARNAQLWLMDHGAEERWITHAGPLPAPSGSDSEPGGRYWDLMSPAVIPQRNFLRLAGDHELSAFYVPGAAGQHAKRWGRETLMDDGLMRRGNSWWLENDRVRLSRGADPPAGLHLAYYYKVDVPASRTLDFPEDDRWLVVAETAAFLKEQSWFPFGDDQKAAIDRYVDYHRGNARRRTRRSREPHRTRARRLVAPHWFS